MLATARKKMKLDWVLTQVVRVGAGRRKVKAPLRNVERKVAVEF